MGLIFEYLRANLRLNKSQADHRRGNFPAVAVGLSFGGGQQRVGNLAHTPHNAAVLNAALQSTPMQRVANFANSNMRLFAPKLHEFYGETLDALCDKDPALKRNFKNNVFACATCNLGPKSVAHVHTDHLNFAPGWCAITAIGNFDPTKGGHLILWDLKIAIEFPPGSTILIPSAILRHSNVPLAGEDECRYALIQYSAGGLFRWVECGHQTQKNFKVSGGEFKQTGRERWARGVGLFSKWADLLAQRKVR
ncbi:hypothetical protein LXA43DRAFT_899041 [Ganoderma leucocontextum]|nr:hypothetical protein LXA43DRAFT_901048 [Ganoderma leucocontextum]KAI1785808.1 hypothetical protein LXA43DRAFT_899041 [Ganoderma leucocontextum]